MRIRSIFGTRPSSPATPLGRPASPLVSWIDTMPVASSDTPCTVSVLDVRAHVCGLYAKVDETLTIANANPRAVSAPMAIPLPDGAVVCGYALDIGGQMVEGVVVPKEQARVAFEAEQRRGVDPGLVEAVKGNVYRTRVYPVPAHGSRTVRLSYVAPLLVAGDSSAALDLPMPAGVLDRRTIGIDVQMPDGPMPRLSGIGDRRFEAAPASWRVESNEHHVAAQDSVRVALPLLPPTFLQLERDTEGTVWFCASEAAPRPAPKDLPTVTTLTVLWDASGSRAGVDHADELAVLKGLCASKAIDSYRLVTFAAAVDDARTFSTAEALLQAVESVRCDGGTDLCLLARSLGDACPAGREARGTEACVLFTDGLDTLCDAAPAFPEERNVLAIVAGTERDAEALRQACGGRVVDVASAPRDAQALAATLFGGKLLASIEGDGVADVIGVGSGASGRLSVVGRLVDDSACIRLCADGEKFTLRAEDARPGATLARAWAAARVAQLSPRASEHADDLLDLGRRFGVVSPATSLLVLESLEQWLRYDIEPPASLEDMRRAWKQARAGRMQNTSSEGRKDDHLRALTREWAGLLAWWRGAQAQNLQNPQEPHPAGTRFCPACGAPTEGGDRFCRRCGASLVRPPAPVRASAPVRGEAPMPMPMPRMTRASMPMEMADCMACAPGTAARSEGFSQTDDNRDGGACASSVQVKPWSADAAYLKALDEALARGTDAAHREYFVQRPGMANAPSFFLDCACWFLSHGDTVFGLQVLTNLAELRIEDAALLRVLAWRLREAGERERALTTLLRVLKLRGEDSQSHRDIAVLLDEMARKAYAAGDEAQAKELAERAGAAYRKTALTPWDRHPMAIALFAVEEYNVLRAWADAQEWTAAPELPSLGGELEGVLASDLRVTLAWDADETDIDIHVTEPSGEEAYFGNRRTHGAGRVSEDIIDGYGPELYEVRRAQDGTYKIRAHYYASHQQSIFGPATCTLTVYTDWGRPGQKQQVASVRLDQEHEMTDVGTARYGE